MPVTQSAVATALWTAAAHCRSLYMFLYRGVVVPDTISHTRAHLTGHVKRFREEGLDAEPVVFGDNRQPDAALLPFETFELLMEIAEDIAIAQRVQAREAEDTGNRTSLGAVAEELGVDLEDL